MTETATESPPQKPTEEGVQGITIDGKTYPLEDLDFDDIEYLEEYTGQPFSTINWAAGKTLKAAVFVFLRRDNPEITLEQVGKMKFVGTFRGVVDQIAPVTDDEPDPQTAAAAGDDPNRSGSAATGSGPRLSAASTRA
ncbi:MAG: hypothetical protein M5T61_10415 [Acidimicrobiia bacterium]|nr:hypothetical protein [Acidimicrobiia bacterium]